MGHPLSWLCQRNQKPGPPALSISTLGETWIAPSSSSVRPATASVSSRIDREVVSVWRKFRVIGEIHRGRRVEKELRPACGHRTVYVVRGGRMRVRDYQRPGTPNSASRF